MSIVTPRRERLAVLAAVAIAGLSCAVAVRFGVHSASHSDASVYVAASALWRTSTLVRPAPLQLWATWPNAIESTVALGFRPGAVTGTEVPMTPPGFPILMAVLSALVGQPGPYLVAPAMGGLMVFATFLLGRRLAGDLAGLIAAGLVALSPVTILNTIYPMSDAPATACWIGAWLLALHGSRSGAVAAGALAALGILVRPNLAPLGIVPFVTVLFAARGGGDGRWRWADAMLFGLIASVGIALVGWTNAVLYGGPLQSGYPIGDGLFRQSRVVENARVYWRLWLEVFGWVPLIGLGTPIWAALNPAAFGPSASRIAWSAVILAVLDVSLYLPYLTFDQWPFLRFLLPATIAVFVLFAAALAAAARWLWARASRRWALVLLPIVLGLTASRGNEPRQFALEEWRAHATIPVMGRYLREALPANAVALSYLHSGAIAHYTHRPVVRLDVIAPPSLDDIVATLDRSGLEPTLVLDAALEQPRFGDLFTGSQFAALDWPPRAEFTGVSTIRYFVLADRARYLAGARWPTDVLR